jgi:glucokinase
MQSSPWAGRTIILPYALGIDVGGTKILAGVVDLNTGIPISTAKKRTKAAGSTEDLLKRIVDVGKDALAQARSAKKGIDIAAGGLGITGVIDRARGVLLGSPNLTGFVNVPLADRLGNDLGLPMTIGNDLEVATLGEQRFGAGKGQDTFVCVFIGTGIGSGIIHEGRYLTGASASAGEIGHAIIAYGGRICSCGGRGHLEAYASRAAITRVIMEEILRGRKTSLRASLPDPLPDLPLGGLIRSQAIAQAVEDGDDLAVEAVTEGAHYLAAGLTAIINFYNPPRIILGGGLVSAVDLYFKVAAQKALDDSMTVARTKVKIVRAKLGDNAGIVGAALLGTPA